MTSEIKKGYLFLLGALLVFIGGMVMIDKVNAYIDTSITVVAPSSAIPATPSCE